ncbi:pro-opiomelanocortin [Notamacropus eugenii]|uniref:pro-opiomelanocortin n=1 Tax=Notamacropus eugenii TaxID=9315 RepID=UPI003B66F8DD
MPKPAWSRLGVLLMALLLQTSESLFPLCGTNPRCIIPEEGKQDAILTGANELKHIVRQRDIDSGSISSDGGKVDQKRQELMQGDLLDLLSPGVWGEDREMQEEGLPLIQKARQLNTKRSFSMEHFRWGKPVGKKRRPVKVNHNGSEEESPESYPVDFKRDMSINDYPEIVEGADDDVGPTDGVYRMEHFRWGTPPKSKLKLRPRNKRYGGFMVSEKSHTPLMTLFKNAIKYAHENGE